MVFSPNSSCLSQARVLRVSAVLGLLCSFTVVYCLLTGQEFLAYAADHPILATMFGPVRDSLQPQIILHTAKWGALSTTNRADSSPGLAARSPRPVCCFCCVLQVAARSLFHRFDGRKSVAADRARELFLTIEEASALDSMLMQARDS